MRRLLLGRAMRLVDCGWRWPRSLDWTAERHDSDGRQCEWRSVAGRLRSDVSEELPHTAQRVAQSTQEQAELMCVALHVVAVSAAHSGSGRSLGLQRRDDVRDRGGRVGQHRPSLSQQ